MVIRENVAIPSRGFTMCAPVLFRDVSDTALSLPVPLME